jgi:hypothetical protein
MKYQSVLAAALVAVTFSAASWPARGETFSPGTATTNVPIYLTDGSYLFGITVTLVAGQFLLPVEATGASDLQSWSLDLSFDNSVVSEVDPGDGSAGIYGAIFDSANTDSLAFITSGFPFNALGQVQAVAGEYPNLLSGVTGDGPLAFILFEYLPDQQNRDPGFRIGGAPPPSIPEPGTFGLAGAGLTLLALTCLRRDRCREGRSINAGQ